MAQTAERRRQLEDELSLLQADVATLCTRLEANPFEEEEKEEEEEEQEDGPGLRAEATDDVLWATKRQPSVEAKSPGRTFLAASADDASSSLGRPPGKRVGLPGGGAAAKKKTSAGTEARLRRAVETATRRLESANWENRRLAAEFAKVQGRAAKYAELQQAHATLQQDYMSLHASLEASEKIRLKQKELLKLLQKQQQTAHTPQTTSKGAGKTPPGGAPIMTMMGATTNGSLSLSADSKHLAAKVRGVRGTTKPRRFVSDASADDALNAAAHDDDDIDDDDPDAFDDDHLHTIGIRPDDDDVFEAIDNDPILGQTISSDAFNRTTILHFEDVDGADDDGPPPPKHTTTNKKNNNNLYINNNNKNNTTTATMKKPRPAGALDTQRLLRKDVPPPRGGAKKPAAAAAAPKPVSGAAYNSAVKKRAAAPPPARAAARAVPLGGLPKPPAQSRRRATSVPPKPPTPDCRAQQAAATAALAAARKPPPKPPPPPPRLSHHAPSPASVGRGRPSKMANVDALRARPRSITRHPRDEPSRAAVTRLQKTARAFTSPFSPPPSDRRAH